MIGMHSLLPLKPSLEGWKHLVVKLQPSTPMPLKPSLEGWKHLWDLFLLLFFINLETFLRGMETAGRRRRCQARRGLETFLRGMETQDTSAEEAPALGLETFLRGMETLHEP